MKRLIPLFVVAAALLGPSVALASGVVLKVQPASKLVAISRGVAHVSLVHTSAKLSVGQRVVLKARTLRNGTLAASSIKVLGRAHSVKFRGLLLAKTGSTLVVSAGGAVITLHRKGRALSSAQDGGPTPGSTISVTATVGSSGELDENSTTTVSPTALGGQMEGHLTIGTGSVTVTSDHMSLVLNVPAGFDLTTFANGDEVLATFSQAADGTLTLSALSANGNASEADSQSGDSQSGDSQSGDSQSGTSGSSVSGQEAQSGDDSQGEDSGGSGSTGPATGTGPVVSIGSGSGGSTSGSGTGSSSGTVSVSGGDGGGSDG